MITLNQVPSINFPEFKKPPTDSESEQLICNEIRMMNEFFQMSNIDRLIDVEQRVTLHYDDLLPMQPQYQSEKISYADYVQRKSEYQIFIYEGRFYDCKGKPITTSSLDFDKGGILVMDHRGNLFLTHKERGVIHHSTFLDGGFVAYACILELIDGELNEEKPWSGHYAPKSSNQAQFHHRINLDFTQPISPNSMTIFLTLKCPKIIPLHKLCLITYEPLFEPVQLPCGHTFSKDGIIKWYSFRQHCPLDRKDFDINDVKPNMNARIDLETNYLQSLNKIRLFNKQLSSKISHIKLDDQESKELKFSIGYDRVGIFLTLSGNSTLEKILKIAQQMGIVTFKNSLLIEGTHIFNDDDFSITLNQIKERRKFPQNVLEIRV